MTDWTKVRNDFPLISNISRNGRLITFLDSGATSQKPQSVIDAMTLYYETYNANIHRGIYDISEKATAAYEESREKIQNFINAASSSEIIYTRNATESINLVAYSWGRHFLKKGDIVVLTEMEHHADLVPWQILAEEAGIVLEFIPIRDDFTLNMEVYEYLLKREPKLVCCSGMSNVTGTIPPIKAMIQAAHEAGALFLIDGAQMVPHQKVDVQDLDVDFLAFSAHKMLGPTGIGTLYAKESLLEKMPPFMGGGDMIKKVFLKSFTCNDLPHKFEAGTFAIAEAIGFGAAIDYLNSIGMDEISAHSHELSAKAIEKLTQVPGLRIFGPTTGNRGAAVSFTLDYAHPHDVAQILDEYGVCVRAGHHCAMPLHERFQIAATTRASFYLYNNDEDINHLVEALNHVHQLFG